jgi:hypothetical protein
MKRWKWVLLVFELALFALILILPQVELPEFTFHGGTAPIATKARLTSPPVRSAIVVVSVGWSLPTQTREARMERSVVPTPTASQSRLSLLCTLLC